MVSVIYIGFGFVLFQPKPIDGEDLLVLVYELGYF